MAYLYFIKVRVLVSMAYRFETISTVLIQLVLLSVNSFFWKAVYAGAGVVSNTTLNEMLVYSVVSLLMSCFFSTSVEGKLRQQIRGGDIAVDIMKPLNLFGMYFADDVGNILVNFGQKAIPMIIFASIFIAPPLPASAIHLLLFVLSLILSFFILWFIAAIFGMINFWVTDIGPLGTVKDHIIGFLSGSIVPIWFFPPLVGKILGFTPFIYIYQLPISIFIGKTSLSEGAFGIVIQAFWCILFYFFFYVMKKKAIDNIMVQGG